MFGYSANNSYFCVVKIASSSEVAFFTGVSVLFLGQERLHQVSDYKRPIPECLAEKTAFMGWVFYLRGIVKYAL